MPVSYCDQFRAMPANAMTHDLRSPAWLESSIRYADDLYISDSEIAERLAKNPGAIQSLLSTIFASMSNRQLRETADSAERWMRDLILCEDEGPLPETLEDSKEGNYLLLHVVKNSRAKRMHFKNGQRTFRRQ